MSQHYRVTKKIIQEVLVLDFVMSVELSVSKIIKVVVIFHFK